MIAGPFKTVVFALLALFLSAGHSVCAELLASSPTSSTPAHESHDATAGGDHHAHYDTAQSAPENNQAPCGSGDTDCQHCDAAQFFKTAAAVELAGLLPAPAASIAIHIGDALASNERVIDATFQAALRRRGPPGDTPVSLKTRLLI